MRKPNSAWWGVIVAVVAFTPPLAAQTEEKPTYGYDAYTDSEGRGEDYWTGKMAELRQRTLILEDELARLDAVTGALRFQWTSIDDPNQQILVKNAWDDAVDRAARSQAELESARMALERAESDAKRSGALPGWIRETTEQEQDRIRTRERETQLTVTYRVDLEELATQNALVDEAIYGETENADEGPPIESEPGSDF